MKLIAGVLISIFLLVSNNAIAVDSAVPQTFDDICQRDASGYPADPDIVNCWGFESDNEFVYHDPTGPNTQCVDPVTGDHLLDWHPNGISNPTPMQNAGINGQTCLYPLRDPTVATSGSHSLKVVQVDWGGGANSGSTFHPYFKYQTGSDGKLKVAGFGAGGEFWVHWRFRQNQGLFSYHSKRFMVTHEQSAFENVLIASGASGLNDPPHNVPCAYNNKGTFTYGCASSKRYEANYWHTFVMYTKLPDNAPDWTNGVFELYMDGELVISRNGVRMGGGVGLLEPYSENIDWETQHSIAAMMRLDFLLFENGKSGTGNRPEGIMWVDDVIVSKAPLPTIIPSGGSVGPENPTSLLTN